MHLIRRLFALSLSILAFVSLSVPAVSQDAGAEPVVSAQEYADRARRLREFGYPQYAREQLEAGARKYPTHKAIVLEHLRLLMRDKGNQIVPWLKLALGRYPYDYDIAFEVAQYLYWEEYAQQRPPDPPRPDTLEQATKRLKAEMTVFVSLADYILKPEAKLPPAADDSVTPAPMLPLAYLARCAKERPNALEVTEFAARYVDMLGCRFHGWAALDPSFTLFGKAAAELFARAIQLWDRAEDDPRYTGYARMRMGELYFRLGKYEEALKQADAADLVVPGSRTVGEILQGIAEKTGDFDLLVKALERKRDAYPNETSRLDVSAAQRVRDNNWPMQLWLTWLELRQIEGPARTSAARALVKEHPEFIELHFVDAALVVELALSPDPPGDYAKMLESALTLLDKCEALGESLVDWHGLRATVPRPRCS
jgi:tetratricopeptide (TPR) repeat protein